VGLYNVFNFANFNLPPNTMTGQLDGSTGSITGTNYQDAFAFRVGNGTGVYSLGAPRQIAVVAVLGYRLVNFWLPLPVGLVAYIHSRTKPESAPITPSSSSRARRPRSRTGSGGTVPTCG